MITQSASEYHAGHEDSKTWMERKLAQCACAKIDPCERCEAVMEVAYDTYLDEQERAHYAMLDMGV